MMKSFFKKLAFVMALAMVVTTAAPAATKAVAANELKVAYQAGGVVTELNMKAGDKEDLKFLGATNWKNNFKWTSSNEAVATVDQTGLVTAVADGTATIIITVGETTGTVAVNVGTAKTYDVTLGTADDKAMTATELKVGESIDLNFYGVKDWNKNNYTVNWSANSDVVTVDTKGIVTAVKAGTAVVTATIVNTVTGVAHNVTPVTVTVPAEEVVPTFTIQQIDTVTVALEFANAMDLSEVTVDDFEVTAIDETFEYTLFANTATVNGNGVTLTFVEGVLTDGAVIKIGYKGAESTLVASNGEVATVKVSYGMNKNYDGNAYVYTELDPDYVLLSYKLYDANGIDVTAKYTEDEDYTIEWTLVNGSDIVDDEPYADENGWQMSFSAKGVAAVQVAVTFTDEDGEDRVVTSDKANIVAVNRPAIAFTYEEAGLVTISKDNRIAQVNSFNTWYGTIWSTNAYNSSIKKGNSAWFGARLTDNRGNGLVSTTLTWVDDKNVGKNDEKPNTGYATGNTEYGDYGYFVYESSNEDVLMIDEEGYVTAVEVGSATILVSFVKYSEDGEEMAPVKVCSKKINVTTDYPNAYAKTFEIINDSLTVTSTGSSMTANAYVKFYDQYGNAYSGFDADDVNAALQVTVPSTYEDATVEIAAGPVWESATGWAPAYKITVSGEDLNDLYTIKDNGYYTFKFTLAFDTDMDEFSKITTKNDKLSVKVYDVDDYYAGLTKFFNGDLKDAVDTDYSKWNYVVSGGASLDVYVDMRSEFDAKSTSEQPKESVSVALYSNAGLKLMNLPEEYFINITGKKVDDINKNEQNTLVEGAIYYQISQPSKAKNVHVATGSAVTFTFNKVNGTEIELATTGNYTVTLYYVNSKDKLVKLDTKTVTITNSTPAVKAEGFISTNVSDEKITDANIKEVLTKMYNFSWNGELLYADYGTWEHKSENFRISGVEYTPGDNKVVVTKVIFEIDYFNNCKMDGEGGVNNHEGGLHQTYELNKRITIKY